MYNDNRYYFLAIFIHLIIFIFPSPLISQDCIIRTVDKSTGHPLVFATVSIGSSGYAFTSTDEDGIAELDCSIISDSIQISYIGYLTVKLSSKDIYDYNDTTLVGMVPFSSELNQIIVNEKRVSLDVNEILRNAIKKIPENYVDDRVKFKGSYTETYEVDDTLMLAVTGKVNISYSGYPARDVVGKSYREYYKNGFNKPYSGIDTIGKWLPLGNPFFFKYYSGVLDSVYVESVDVRDYDRTNQFKFTTDGGPKAMLALDKVKYLSDILDKKLLSSYKFELSSVIETANGLVDVISFKPLLLDRIKGIHWDEKVKYPILSGRIYIQRNTSIIEKIECQFAKNGKLFGYRIEEPWQIFPSSTTLEIFYSGGPGSMLIERVIVRQECLANSSIKWAYKQNLRLVRELVRVEDDIDSPDQNSKGVLYEDVYGANFADMYQFFER